ncbi:von Willebrand factor C domain-containing protein 2-like [Mya arenaria]|uniref:von Willebrand factor C domain-containing protein 2-like n=1 Tax=Mya arenaria TaxID=6604 RepID=UPI0022E72A3D|nr:von Willebrand factor C domain-containing protein 2-like [Mya arenaria]
MACYCVPMALSRHFHCNHSPLPSKTSYNYSNHFRSVCGFPRRCGEIRPCFHTVTAPQGCTWNGTLYQVGDSIRKSPCQPCQCGQNGQIFCAIVDCFFTPCVDTVQDPNQCCLTYPNGNNYQGPDGTIVKQGEVYKPDAFTVCECPQTGPSSNRVKCISRTPSPSVSDPRTIVKQGEVYKPDAFTVCQ